MFNLNIFTSKSQKDCNAHNLQYQALKRRIPDLEQQLSHTDNLIHKKTVLHGEYWPIPGRSCRQSLRQDIADLKQRQLQIQTELNTARSKYEQSFEALIKFAQEGIAVPPKK